MHRLSWEILGLPNEVMEQINTAGLQTIHQPPKKNQRCPRQNSCQTKERISRVRIINRQSERFRAGRALQGHAAQCAKLWFPTTIQKLAQLPEIICTHLEEKVLMQTFVSIKRPCQRIWYMYFLFMQKYHPFHVAFLAFLLLLFSYQRFYSRQTYLLQLHSTQHTGCYVSI